MRTVLALVVAAVVAAGLAGAFLWKRGDLPGATVTVSTPGQGFTDITETVAEFLSISGITQGLWWCAVSAWR